MQLRGEAHFAVPCPPESPSARCRAALILLKSHYLLASPLDRVQGSRAPRFCLNTLLLLACDRAADVTLRTLGGVGPLPSPLPWVAPTPAVPCSHLSF